ncbi:uncharacterized protein C2orf73 homolog isoform X2 [Ostrea edulis]|uniref:uncharacterized protein C2orf73 homolog isoform X2 n=1 Tax=Ostrea edulis TaxID=37623 RepID=UPI0020962FEB|nr:uncharacterized protein C2orf73 homolog isoform X2 [Ostrea edulis]
MTLYMPPLQRKKRVPNRYNPDSFRVISNDAETTHERFSGIHDYRPPSPERFKKGISLPNIYNRNTQVLPKTVPDFRANNPHPRSCGFLRHDVRLLNEPICSVYTSQTHDEQDMWWPSRTSDEPLQVPEKTKDTIYRGDYMKEHNEQLHRATRHESNTNREPALGPVPVNFLTKRDGAQRIFQEKKSYEHDYNSRKDLNYPIRGKRLGSFVWDEMSPELAKRFVDQHTNLLEAKEKFEANCQSQKSNPTTPMSPPHQPTPPGNQQNVQDPSSNSNLKTVTFQEVPNSSQ